MEKIIIQSCTGVTLFCSGVTIELHCSQPIRIELLLHVYYIYYTVIKHAAHLRAFEKCRKQSPVARLFLISLVFSNACRVLSQYDTRLWLLYLLNKMFVYLTIISRLQRAHMSFLFFSVTICTNISLIIPVIIL